MPWKNAEEMEAWRNPDAVAGLIEDISIEEYHSREGISRSGVVEILKSPRHYFNRYIAKMRNDESTREQVFGQAFHTFLLENHKFKDSFFVAPKLDRRTIAGKEEWHRLQQENQNKVSITEEEYLLIEKYHAAVEEDAVIKSLISNAQCEKSIFWTKKTAAGPSIVCKARPDAWKSGIVCDIKTAHSADEYDFKRAVMKYGYHIQAAMIKEAIKFLTGETIEMFVFLVFEKSYMTIPAIYALDEQALEEGARLFNKAINIYYDCLFKNEWPGYEMKTISLPKYAFSEE